MGKRGSRSTSSLPTSSVKGGSGDGDVDMKAITTTTGKQRGTIARAAVAGRSKGGGKKVQGQSPSKSRQKGEGNQLDSRKDGDGDEDGGDDNDNDDDDDGMDDGVVVDLGRTSSVSPQKANTNSSNTNSLQKPRRSDENDDDSDEEDEDYTPGADQERGNESGDDLEENESNEDNDGDDDDDVDDGMKKEGGKSGNQRGKRKRSQKESLEEQQEHVREVVDNSGFVRRSKRQQSTPKRFVIEQATPKTRKSRATIAEQIQSLTSVKNKTTSLSEKQGKGAVKSKATTAAAKSREGSMTEVVPKEEMEEIFDPEELRLKQQRQQEEDKKRRLDDIWKSLNTPTSNSKTLHNTPATAIISVTLSSTAKSKMPIKSHTPFKFPDPIPKKVSNTLDSVTTVDPSLQEDKSAKAQESITLSLSPMSMETSQPQPYEMEHQSIESSSSLLLPSSSPKRSLLREPIQRPKSRLSQLATKLGLYDAVTKLNTLEKSKLDWIQHVENTGDADKLRRHNMDGHIEKMAFLSRADERQHEFVHEGKKRAIAAAAAAASASVNS